MVMRKKDFLIMGSILLLQSSLLFANSSSSKVVTPDFKEYNLAKLNKFKAVNKQVVKNFIKSHKKENKIASEEVLFYNNKAVGIVYNLAPTGYMVTTLNRNEVPIKSYSFENSFDKHSEDYKTFIKIRLYDYSNYIEEYEKLTPIVTNNYKIWEYYENYSPEISESLTLEEVNINLQSSSNHELPPAFPMSRSYQIGEHLTQTLWNQTTSPLNLANPLHGQAGVTGSTPAGCVPTAWGQIMKYYEFPSASVGGTYSYYWNYGNQTLSTNLNRTYNWEAMNNHYTSTGITEISTLIKNLGYVLNTEYQPNIASAIDDGFVLERIKKYFGYSKNITHDDYTDFHNTTSFARIRDKLKVDIDKSQPLLFHYGWENNGQHAHITVADGYRNIIEPFVSYEVHLNQGDGTSNFYKISVPASDADLTITVHNATLVLSYIGIFNNIKPCTLEANDCHSEFISNGGEPKEPLSLKYGWNLVALKTSNQNIDYRDFDSASEVQIFRQLYNIATGHYYGTYTANPNSIEPKQGIWIKSNSDKNYYFPGSATSITEPDSSYVSNIKDILSQSEDAWTLIGTGRKMSVNLIKNNFSDYYLYENDNWVHKSEIDARGVIEGGIGIWVKR